MVENLLPVDKDVLALGICLEDRLTDRILSYFLADGHENRIVDRNLFTLRPLLGYDQACLCSSMWLECIRVAIDNRQQATGPEQVLRAINDLLPSNTPRAITMPNLPPGLSH